MYHLILVDNLPDHIEIVKDMISRFPQNERFTTTCFQSESELISHLNGGGKVDILLMDIELESTMDGVDVIQKHFPPNCGTEVIYVSGYAEHSTRVYRTEHTYFLLKPVDQKDFDDALDKALLNLSSHEDRPVYVQSGSNITVVSPKRIRFIESVRRKVRIYTDGEPLETYASLAEMHSSLPSLFIRCHKSFLVNMDYIADLQKDSIRLFSGETIPVSQRNRSAVKRSFLAYLQDR